MSVCKKRTALDMIGKVGYPSWMLDARARAAYLARLRDQKKVKPVQTIVKPETKGKQK
jgi:hypothetical protein